MPITVPDRLGSWAGRKSKKKTKKYKNIKNNKCEYLNVFTANAAGLKNRVPSLKSELQHLGSGIFTLQETHYKKKGKLNIENWEIFEAIRKKDFGGTMIGVHKALST